MKLTLKAARVNAGLSRQQAGLRIGVGPSTLGNYERGESFPTVPILKKIEQIYGIPYENLVFGDSPYYETSTR